MYARSHGLDGMVKFKSSIRIEKKSDLSDSEHGVVVAARWIVSVFHKLLICCDFFFQGTISRVYRELFKQRKYTVSGG